jgi:hypothetical protein
MQFKCIGLHAKRSYGDSGLCLVNEAVTVNDSSVPKEIERGRQILPHEYPGLPHCSGDSMDITWWVTIFIVSAKCGFKMSLQRIAARTKLQLKDKNSKDRSSSTYVCT